MFTTFVVPTEEKVVYCIVFHDDSFARMQRADPAVMTGEHMAAMVGAQPKQAMAFEQFDVMFCYEPSEAEFQVKCEELETPQAVFHWLTRNWKDEATDGGHPIRVRIGNRGAVN